MRVVCFSSNFEFAALCLLSGDQEEAGWALDVVEIERALKAATAEGIRVRGIVVINPGNPTGQVLSEERLREVSVFVLNEGAFSYAFFALDFSQAVWQYSVSTIMRALVVIHSKETGK